jgi:hypothetical protein
MYEEIIKNRIKQLSPEYQKFVVGDFVDATTRTYSEAFNLDEERSAIFENGLMLYLLMIINQQKLIEFMCEECDFTLENAQIIVTDIIANLPPSLVYAINQSYEELNTITSEPAIPSPQEPIPQNQNRVVPITSNLSRGNTSSAWQPVGQTIPSPQTTYQASTPPVVPPITPPLPPKPSIPAFTQQPVTPQPTPPAPAVSSVQPVVPPTAPTPSVPTFVQQPVTPQPSPAPRVQPVTVADIESRMPPLPTTHTPTQASRFQALNEVAVPITPPPATNIQPVRTMEHDAQRIHGYAAYREQYPHLYTDEDSTKETVRGLAQDALLQQRVPIVDTPRFDEPRG